MVAQVDAACSELNGFSVWLPEHLAKTHESAEEGEAIVREADDRFRSTLESLDPPDSLRGPIEALAQVRAPSADTEAALEDAIQQEIGLFGEIGATGCRKELQASLLTLGGKSVEAAYRQVGLELPPRPAGW